MEHTLITIGITTIIVWIFIIFTKVNKDKEGIEEDLYEKFKDRYSPRYEVNSFRLNRNYNLDITKGRIFSFVNGKIWMLATPTKPCALYYWDYKLIKDLYMNNSLESIELDYEKYIHPHINKEVKKYYPRIK